MMGAHVRLTPATRREIAVRIDMLIGILDADDAPFADLEPETDADHVELFGESLSDDGTEIMATRPAYGVDQSRGPTNGASAYRDHRARELGLLRTATGWRMPV